MNLVKPKILIGITASFRSPLIVSDLRTQMSSALLESVGEENGGVSYIKETNEQNQYKVVLTPKYFHEALIKSKRLMESINRLGYCTGKDKLTVTMIGEQVQGPTITPMKFVLGFRDEDLVALAVKSSNPLEVAKNSIISKAQFLAEKINFQRGLNPQNFSVSGGSRFGIDLTRINESVVKFSYIRGERYADKVKELETIINRVADRLVECIQSPMLGPTEMGALTQVYERATKISHQIKTHDTMKLTLPNVHVLVDLREDVRAVNHKWNFISEKLMKIMMSSTGIDKGAYVNLNTDTGRIEIAESKMNFSVPIQDTDFTNCELSGQFESCAFMNSVISNSRAHDCSFISDNSIKHSVIRFPKFTEGSFGNRFSQSYIENQPKSYFIAEAYDSTLVNGVIDPSSKIERCRLNKAKHIKTQ